VRILLWHVHGSWTTAFVQGAHEYFVPVLPGRGPDGRGRAQTWRWPASVKEVSPEQLRELAIDLVVLQRPRDAELAELWLGRRPGVELPAVYVEHNAPQGRIAEMRHPMADRPELTLVHVTHFNDLFWDAGSTPTRVIEHGIVDPGYRYTGELPRAAVVINEARRRARVTGTDLLDRFAEATPIDLFGMDAAGAVAPPDGDATAGKPRPIGAVEDVPQATLHEHMARRRVYLHPIRWTSLGLSLIEAMHLGMPIVALATTEAPDAVPSEAGVISTRVQALADAIRGFIADRERAEAAGRAAREAALRRYGLERFLRDWDELLAEVGS
jgi:Glycosyl transferases group 1